MQCSIQSPEFHVFFRCQIMILFQWHRFTVILHCDWYVQFLYCTASALCLFDPAILRNEQAKWQWWTLRNLQVCFVSFRIMNFILNPSYTILIMFQENKTRLPKFFSLRSCFREKRAVCIFTKAILSYGGTEVPTWKIMDFDHTSPGPIIKQG